MKRVFVAIDISAAARQKAADYTLELRRAFPDLRVGWERPEKLHLTLKFLGDVEDHTLFRVEDIVRRVAGSYSPFDIQLGGTGSFPPKRETKILWVGIQDDGSLAEIAKQIEKECSTLGFEAEKRKFNPHLTIARLREPHRSADLAKTHLEIGFEPVGFEVREIVIYESKLLPRGSIYTPIAKFPLKES